MADLILKDNEESEQESMTSILIDLIKRSDETDRFVKLNIPNLLSLECKSPKLLNLKFQLLSALLDKVEYSEESVEDAGRLLETLCDKLPIFQSDRHTAQLLSNINKLIHIYKEDILMHHSEGVLDAMLARLEFLPT